MIMRRYPICCKRILCKWVVLLACFLPLPCPHSIDMFSPVFFVESTRARVCNTGSSGMYFRRSGAGADHSERHARFVRSNWQLCAAGTGYVFLCVCMFSNKYRHRCFVYECVVRGSLPVVCNEFRVGHLQSDNGLHTIESAPTQGVCLVGPSRPKSCLDYSLSQDQKGNKKNLAIVAWMPSVELQRPERTSTRPKTVFRSAWGIGPTCPLYVYTNSPLPSSTPQVVFLCFSYACPWSHGSYCTITFADVQQWAVS